MNRIIKTLLTGLLVISLFGCASNTGKPTKDQRSVVVTVYPAAEWVNAVLGEDTNAELTLLLDGGTDLHSYQPGAADIMKIASCDVFVYIGGPSDEWVNDALKEAVNPDMTVINLMDELGSLARYEETVEGMQEEEAEEGDEYDEHIWMSLKNAQLLTERIADRLAEADPEHAKDYRENSERYIQSLKELDQEYEDMVKGAAFDTILVADRFPFRYLAEDYGLHYYAAFSGCSGETEASFETVRFLSEKLKELNLPAVLTIEGSDQKIARTVAETAGRSDVPILVLNSMQGITAKDQKNGVTYLSVMEDNFTVLKQALNETGETIHGITYGE